MENNPKDDQDAPSTQLSRSGQPARFDEGAFATWVEGDEVGASGGFGLFVLVTHSVRRWWKLALPLGLLLAAGGAWLAWSSVEQTYRGSVWFSVNTRRNYIVFPTQTASDRFVQTQVELVRSSTVLSPIIREKDIADYLERLEVDEPLDWLTRNLEVKSIGESELLEVALECDDRQMAKRIVDAVSNSYWEFYLSETKEQRQALSDALNERKVKLEDQITKLRNEVIRTTQDTLGKDPYRVENQDETNTISRQKSKVFQFEDRKLNLELDLNLAQAALDSFLRDEIPEEEIVKALSADQRVIALTKERDQIKTQLKQQIDGLLVSESSSTLQAEALKKEEELENARIAVYRQLLAQQERAPDRALIEQRVRTDPDIERLQQEIEAREDAWKQQSKIAHPGRLPDRYGDLLAEIEKEKERLQAKKVELAKELLTRAKIDLDAQASLRFEELVGAVESLRTKIEMVADRLARLEDHSDKSDSTGVVTLNLEFARSDLARAENVHQRLSERILELEIEEGAPNQVTKKTDATVARTPTLARATSKIAVLSLAGLFIPFGLGITWDGLRRHIFEASQIRDALQIPVLGEISTLPSRPSLLSPVSAGRRRLENLLYEESILNLASNVTYGESMANVKVLAIASAVGGEGKSTLATQLAAGLARSHRLPVLLIDGDLRAPSVGKTFSLNEEVGLAQVLGGECQPEDAIQVTTNPNLFVLPAGGPEPAPHHLFSNDTMGSLLKELRPRYRFIVLDTPPVLSSGEALSLARLADATIISTLKDVSLVSQVSQLLERVSSVGGRVVGAVISGVSPRAYRRTYGPPSSPREPAVSPVELS